MKQQTKKHKKIKFFLILFMIIGIILVLDGMVSIALQPDQSLLYQSGRIARSTMGFILFVVSFMVYGKK